MYRKRPAGEACLCSAAPRLICIYDQANKGKKTRPEHSPRLLYTKVATCQASVRTSCYCNLFLKEIREMNLQLLRKLLLVGVVWAYSITKAYSSGMSRVFVIIVHHCVFLTIILYASFIAVAEIRQVFF